MFEYQFKRVPLNYGKGYSSRIEPAVYESEIKLQAEEGWRLVQIFIENPAAIPTEYVLVFERTKANPSD